MRVYAIPALAAGLLAIGACGEDSPTDPGPPIPGLATIEVTPESDTLTAIDETLQLTAVARDSSGAVIPGVTFAWASSDASVAMVGAATGLATAKAGGTAAVTASAGGKSGGAELVVSQAVATIEVEPGVWSPRWPGDRKQFEATARDANGHPVPGVTFTWLSNDPGVARVDQAGVVTALATGATTLAASGADSTGEAAITVPEFGNVLEGVVYTVWFARADSAPALLVDGSIRTPNIWDEPTPAAVWGRDNVAKFQWRGDRIGLLTDVVGGAGHLQVRDRVGEWSLLAEGVAVDFALSGDLIVLVRSDGSLLVKESLTGPWTTISSGGVQDWQVAGGRYFGLVDDAGAFWAKDGVDGTWWLLADGGVKDFQLTSGGRIGLLSEDGEFKVKDGVTGAWTTLVAAGAGGATGFRLNGNRIVVQGPNGSLAVKDGIDGPWTQLVAQGTREVALAGDVIGVLMEDGSFRAKEGINGTWALLVAGGVREIQLQGDLVGYLSESGSLAVKQGINGGWRSTGVIAGDITQFRLLVDVPLPPDRITPAEYTGEQAECAADTGGADCTSPWAFGLVPVYGRYCGDDIPADADWQQAEDSGPIDPLDTLCRHHDFAGSWYPEAIGAAGCIVRYGLHYSRLTQDGELLTHGDDSKAGWDAGWGNLMPNLKDAIDAYFDYTNTCPLTDFIENTASQN